jgi:hypothetical protein
VRFSHTKKLLNRVCKPQGQTVVNEKVSAATELVLPPLKELGLDVHDDPYSIVSEYLLPDLSDVVFQYLVDETYISIRLQQVIDLLSKKQFKQADILVNHLKPTFGKEWHKSESPINAILARYLVAAYEGWYEERENGTKDMRKQYTKYLACFPVEEHEYRKYIPATKDDYFHRQIMTDICSVRSEIIV